MTRIHKRKTAPKVVEMFFNKKFPSCTFQYYSYKGRNGKTFGCFVYKDGELWSYSDQGTEESFANYYAELINQT